MKEIVQHPIYGQIVYNESFWTGKKTLTINGVCAQPVSKKEFTVEGKKVVIIGSSLMGLKLQIDNDIIEVFPKPKWYEIVFAVLPLIFLLTWGNSIALCSIFPVVGGKMLHRHIEAFLLLHPTGHSRSHSACQIGILGPIFEVASAKR